MNNNIILTDFDPNYDASIEQRLDGADDQAKASIKRIYAALGAMLLAADSALQNTAVRDEMESHLIAIDEEARCLKDTVIGLTSEFAALVSLARTFRNQRDDAMYELKDALNRVDEAQTAADANIYQRMLENIETPFDCSRKAADAILCALWEVDAKVTDDTAEMLDSIANVIGESDVERWQ